MTNQEKAPYGWYPVGDDVHLARNTEVSIPDGYVVVDSTVSQTAALYDTATGLVTLTTYPQNGAMVSVVIQKEKENLIG